MVGAALAGVDLLRGRGRLAYWQMRGMGRAYRRQRPNRFAGPRLEQIDNDARGQARARRKRRLIEMLRAYRAAARHCPTDRGGEPKPARQGSPSSGPLLGLRYREDSAPRGRPTQPLPRRLAGCRAHPKRSRRFAVSPAPR